VALLSRRRAKLNSTVGMHTIDFLSLAGEVYAGSPAISSLSRTVRFIIVSN
jgi:hypothetical protein